VSKCVAALARGLALSSQLGAAGDRQSMLSALTTVLEVAAAAPAVVIHLTFGHCTASDCVEGMISSLQHHDVHIRKAALGLAAQLARLAQLWERLRAPASPCPAAAQALHTELMRGLPPLVVGDSDSKGRVLAAACLEQVVAIRSLYRIDHVNAILGSIVDMGSLPAGAALSLGRLIAERVESKRIIEDGPEGQAALLSARGTSSALDIGASSVLTATADDISLGDNADAGSPRPSEVSAIDAGKSMHDRGGDEGNDELKISEGEMVGSAMDPERRAAAALCFACIAAGVSSALK